MSDEAGLFHAIFARGLADTGDRAWLRAMLQTEAALAWALEHAGLAPAGAGAAVESAARIGNVDVADIAEQVALTGNPVPALVRALTRLVPAEAAQAVHRGATSQDIMDTAAMLLARQAIDGILTAGESAGDAAARLAREHAGTVMIGRTLLQQAVPVTFGLVAAGWLAGLDEACDGLRRVRDSRLAVQFGGAAGTLAPLGTEGPAVARLLARRLGLGVPAVPWHTIRLRLVEVAAACAGATAVLGKIGRDVTLLAQTEVAEVSEGEQVDGAPARASGGRGGSSTMPHKHNPVAAVSVLACTRQVPGLLATLTAAAEHEHQRAAGAWHAEWEPFTQVLRLTQSAAVWTADLLAGLVVDAERMRANLDSTGGLPLAERVAGLLAPAMGRIPAHDIIARASEQAVTAGIPLRQALDAPGIRPEIDAAGVTPDQLDAALDPAGYLGASAEFIEAALAAHAGRAARQGG